MAYIYYSNNPKGRRNIGDCVIRAVSKALEMSWDASYIDLVLQGYISKDMPSSNDVLNSYLHAKGFKRYAIPDRCPDCYSFEDFANDHPEGTYIDCTGTHVACNKDGCIYDSWNSSDCVPIFYYEKEQSQW